ncbi:hypothetical protein EDD15DRAFT_2205126 [Pisolithus albus]|nr:hypothetical protein EDD15DRAFT_2205126 [Pisolithus albus]
MAFFWATLTRIFSHFLDPHQTTLMAFFWATLTRFLTEFFAFLGPLLDRSPPDYLDLHQAALTLDCDFHILGPFLGQTSVGLPLFWTAFFFLGELSCTVLSPNTSVSTGTFCADPIMPTPPTSPQLAHDATRQAERDQRVLGSPPSRRQPHHPVQAPPALITNPPVPVHQYIPPAPPFLQPQMMMPFLPPYQQPPMGAAPPPPPQILPQRVDYTARLLEGFNQDHERRRQRRCNQRTANPPPPPPPSPPHAGPSHAPPPNYHTYQQVTNFQHETEQLRHQQAQQAHAQYLHAMQVQQQQQHVQSIRVQQQQQQYQWLQQQLF